MLLNTWKQLTCPINALPNRTHSIVISCDKMETAMEQWLKE
jgi:hypothetical protein